MKLTKKQYKNIFIATLALLVWQIPYLCSIFYVQFQEYYAVTDGQIGFILSSLGFTTVIGYTVGGVVADKFPVKGLLIASSMLTGILGVIMAFTKNYYVICAIHFAFGITGALIGWNAFLKYIRFIGNDEVQGKAFGFFEMAYAILGVVTSYALLAFMDIILAKYGFFVVVLVYALLDILAGIIIWLFLDKPEYESAGAAQVKTEGSFSVKDIGKAFKQPVTWFNAFIVLGLFIVSGTTTYVTPIMQTVFGLSATLVVGVGIFKRYAVRLFLTPMGGSIIDKKGKSSGLIIYSCLATIVFFVIMLFLPQAAPYGMLFFIVSTAIAIPTTIVRPAYYTPVGEAETPAAITGTVMGIVSGIGYCTDLWLYNLCGGWLDKFGNAGYNYIWILSIVGLLMSAVSAFFFQRYLYNKRKASLTTAE